MNRKSTIWSNQLQLLSICCYVFSIGLLLLFISPAFADFDHEHVLIEIEEFFDFEEESKKESKLQFEWYYLITRYLEISTGHPLTAFLKEDFNYCLWSHRQIGKFIRLEIHSLTFYG